MGKGGGGAKVNASKLMYSKEKNCEPKHQIRNHQGLANEGGGGGGGGKGENRCENTYAKPRKIFERE